MFKPQKVIVGMSGGVDSSVAAAELKDAGHDVVGVTMRLWGGESDTGCCSVSDVDDARRVAQQLGIDPMHFGLVMVLNLMIGLLTPPVGLVLFIMARISKLSIERTIVAILPWFAPLLISLFIITYVPQVVLWLPNLTR